MFSRGWIMHHPSIMVEGSKSADKESIKENFLYMNAHTHLPKCCALLFTNWRPICTLHPRKSTNKSSRGIIVCALSEAQLDIPPAPNKLLSREDFPRIYMRPFHNRDSSFFRCTWSPIDLRKMQSIWSDKWKALKGRMSHHASQILQKTLRQ